MKVRVLKSVSALALVVSMANAPAAAEVVRWNGGATGHEHDWNESTNWLINSGHTPGRTPTENDVAIIENAAYSPLISGSDVLAGDLRIGLQTPLAFLNIHNAGKLTTTSTTLGYNASASGALSISDSGSLLKTDFLTVGHQGGGAVIISNAATVQGGVLSVGGLGSGNGTVALQSSATMSTSEALIGVGGVGQISALASAINSTTISIAANSGSTGTVSLSSGSTWNGTGTLTIGSAGNGTVNLLSGSQMSASNTVRLGAAQGSSGVLSIQGPGSALNANSGNAMIAGDQGNSTIQLANGGELNIGQGLGTLIMGNKIGSTSQLHIGSLASVAPAAAGHLNAKKLQFGQAGGFIHFNHSDTDYVFGASISGAGHVIHSAGTTRLTGINSYTGFTNLLGGTLIGDSSSLTGPIFAASGTRLVFDQAADGAFNGSISGYGSLVKSGSGRTLISSSSSLYDISVTEGALEHRHSGSAYSAFIGGLNGAELAFRGADADWNITHLRVGENGPQSDMRGQVSLFEGAKLATSSSILGLQAGSEGRVTLSGGSSWTAMPTGGSLTVGALGKGYVDILEGSILETVYTAFGTFGSGRGILNVAGNGSRWSNAGLVELGVWSAGNRLTVTDGGSVDTDVLIMGTQSGSGEVLVSGAGSSLTARMHLGINEGSKLTIANGGMVDIQRMGASGNGILALNGELIIGAEQNDAATGAGILKSADIYGTSGAGIVLNHTDNDYIFSSAIAGATSVRVFSGTTRLTGANTYSGGTLIHGGVLEILSEASLGTGFVEIGGMNSGTATLRFAADATFGRNIKLHSNQAIIDSGANQVTINGVISGNPMVSLRKKGSGTLTLAGTNTYQGNSWIDEGTLVGRPGSFGSGFIVAAENTKLVLEGSHSPLFETEVRGAGTLIKRGINTLETTQSNGIENVIVEQGALATRVDGGLGGKNLQINWGTAAGFLGSAKTGNLNILNEGTLVFADTSSAERASITNNARAALLLFPLTAPGTSIGRINGAGDILLGDKALTLGGTNLNSDISGVISGVGGSLVKTGSGVLTLSGANNFSGGTQVNAGTLSVTSQALGLGGVTLAGGTRLDYAADGYFANGITLAGNSSLNVADGIIAHQSGRISGTGGFTKTGAGELVLWNPASNGYANDYAGATHISEGRLVVHGDAINDLSAVRVDSGATLALGTLWADTEVIGSLSGSGAVDLGGRTLNAGGDNHSTSFSGTIASTGGHGVLVKSGTGTFTFTGTGSHANTVVEAGTLKLNGTLSGDLAIGRGASLLGKGTVGGALGIDDGGVLIGKAGQTLNIGSLNLGQGSVIDVTLGASDMPALFNVAGNLVLDGTLNITDGLGFAPGITRLFDYAGKLIDNGLAIGSTSSGTAEDYFLLTSIGGQVNLANTVGLTLNFWDGGAIDRHHNHAVDGGSGVWSADASHWTDATGVITSAMRPNPGFAVFGGAAGQVTIDATRGQVATAGMQFLTDGYVLAGDALTLSQPHTIVRVGDGTDAGAAITTRINAVLTGNGGLQKTDAGTLILTGANDYSGGTLISGGTLVGSANSFGSGTITNNALLHLTQNLDASMANNLAGTGTIRKLGGAILTLAGDGSAYSGDTIVSEGTLLLTGSLAGSANILQDGVLQVGNAGAQGDLIASTHNDGTLIFARSDDYDYRGALAGNGALIKRGDGLLKLSGAYSYTGSTVVEGGRIQLNAQLNPETDLVLNGGIFDLGQQQQTVSGLAGANGQLLIGGAGQLTLQQNFASTFGGGFSGNGALVMAGPGHLNLVGASDFTGLFRVQSGLVSFNNMFAGTVDVQQFGRVGGSGRIGGLIVQGGGIAAPGNSIGTLKVTGNVKFEAGSIYDVETSAIVGADHFGLSDQIAAGGKATINGGTVNVIAEAGSYAPVTTYKILTADGGLTGQFENVVDNYAYLNSALSYDANNVYLKLVRNDISFSAGVSTLNQKATASAVESLHFTNAIYHSALMASESEIGGIFNQLSGELHASSRTALYEDSRLPRAAILSRLGAAPAKGGSAWMQAFGNWGSSYGDGNARKLDRDTTGFLLGFDMGAGENWTLGFTGGRTESDLSGAAGNATIKATHVLGYAGAHYGPIRLKFGLGYAAADFDARRTVNAGDINDGLKSGYDGEMMQGFAELGYAVPLGGGALEPFASVASVRVKTDPFAETGGITGLSINRSARTTTATTLGFRMETPAAGNLSLKTMMGWQHAFGALAPQSTQRLAGSDPFTINGTPISRNAGIAEIEARLKLTPAIELGAGYQGMLGTAGEDHAVTGKFSIRF